MGQGGSMPIPRRKSFKKPFHSPFNRRSTAHGSLSATFNYNDNDIKVNQLNVNIATEEELMTLPGITRSIAHNIVEYRQAIGRFNKVEDLALVSGIGADRLEQIRPEICVTRKKHFSSISSRTQSTDSLSSSEISPNNIRPPVDINTATVFQLMTVRGINQELAAAIVEYRERRGDFFSVDDLIKVKGMGHVRLSSLRPRLSVKPDLRLTGKETFPEHPRIPNGKVPEFTLSNGLLVKDVFDLVSTYSQRPPYQEIELPKNTIRIATWNLTDLCKDKASNTAVREVFCLTLLENKISFVALQGVRESSALQMICDEFKYPLCKKLREWKGLRGDWKSDFVPIRTGDGLYNLGFIYNLEAVSVSPVKAVQDNSMIRAVGACLILMGQKVPVLNVHLASKAAESSFKTVVSSLQSHIIMGDFSAVNSLDGKFVDGYQSVMDPEDTKSSNESKSSFYDNIYVKDSEISKFSGKGGVVRAGLTHLAIPKGWNWNGSVSEHCPVWAQISF